ncbi:MAG: ABC transporter ATP-binding protein [Clostridia bacterium]|nr:ABC transporter ATP-binding protein [Clostridia bacterium]
MQTQPLLSVNGLTKYYGAFPSLSDFSLTLTEGKIVALLGPNGSGKTTLLKIIAGLLTPNAGSVSILGCPPGEEARGVVAYLPDRISVPGWMSSEKAFSYFADFYADFDREKAGAMLADLGIPLDKPLGKLSKGMREKVQLSLVMSRRAKLYLLDEPISGVDPAAREYILRTILTCHAPDSTVLISTHLIADVEEVIDEFVFIREGKLLCYDSADEARKREGKTVDEMFREAFRC